MHGQETPCREEGEEGRTNPKTRIQTEIVAQVEQDRQEADAGKGRVPPKGTRDYMKVPMVVV